MGSWFVGFKDKERNDSGFFFDVLVLGGSLGMWLRGSWEVVGFWVLDFGWVLEVFSSKFYSNFG